MKQEYPTQVKKWDVFEVSLPGPMEGNPFQEQRFQGIFTHKNESVVVEGFYDGQGIYKIRFMPSHEGRYTFVLKGTFLEETLSGVFYAVEADEDNHGPVRIANGTNFAYEDGTTYYPMGTTTLGLVGEEEDRIRETIDTLEFNQFNKVRLAVLPVYTAYHYASPVEFPYIGTPKGPSTIDHDNWKEFLGKDNGNSFDLTRFNPHYFERIEFCIEEMGKRGIEVELIGMHPYDRWGFASMSNEQDDLYWNYIINRFSAYHNVWWCVANEYNRMIHKSLQDFERIAKLIVDKDNYNHLRSIHNAGQPYDYSRAWITHCSYKSEDIYKSAEVTSDLIIRYGKPVIVDELGFEGDLPYGWGNLTGEEVVRRFYECALRGGYPGHGETFLHEEDILWSLHGGTLHGESAQRLDYLYGILKEVPGTGLSYNNNEWDSVSAVPTDEKELDIKSQYIYYYSFMRPSSRSFYIDDETDYKVEVIDTWNMKKEKVGIFNGKFDVNLPTRPYMAVRLTKAVEEDYLEEPEEEQTSFDAGENFWVQANDDETIFPEKRIEEVLIEEPVEEKGAFEKTIEEQLLASEDELPRLIEEDILFDEQLEAPEEASFSYAPNIESSIEEEVVEENSEEVELPDVGRFVSPEEVVEESEDTDELDLESLKMDGQEEDELPDIVTGAIPVQEGRKPMDETLNIPPINFGDKD